MRTLPPYMHEYSGWSIHGTWNDLKGRWDCIAVKGDLEMATEDMNWHQFISALDRVDGKSGIQDFLESMDPMRQWPWMPPTGQGIPRNRVTGALVGAAPQRVKVSGINMPIPMRALAAATPLFDLEAL